MELRRPHPRFVRSRAAPAALAVVLLASCATSSYIASPAVRVIGDPVPLGESPAGPERSAPAEATIDPPRDPPESGVDAEPDVAPDVDAVAGDDVAAPPAAAMAHVPVTVAVADPPIEPVGTDGGPLTQRAQERLLQLGFWLAGPNGDYDLTTRQAVMAFQKYHGLETDGVLGPLTAEALTAATTVPAGRADAGTLVEVDKSLQLVFIVVDGSTEWILNASTGSEIPYREPDQNTPGAFQEGNSVTRPGFFEVDRERPDGWWAGDLGEIYRPKYFDGGIALHGSNSVPNYPASHGCVRVSVPAMDWIWEAAIVPMGTPVWVHGEIPVRG